MNTKQIKLLTAQVKTKRRAVKAHYIFQYVCEKYNVTQKALLIDCHSDTYYCWNSSLHWMNNPMHWDEECHFKTLITDLVASERLLDIALQGGCAVYARLQMD